MNFITSLSLLEEYNVIIITINRLIKKHYYILYFVNKNGIFVETMIDILIKNIF